MADIFIAPKQNEKKKNANKTIEPCMNMLSSFCKNPQGISFEIQKEDESIILFLRPHLLTNLPWILFSILLAFLPLGIKILSPVFGINFLSSGIFVHFLITFILLYYLIIFSYILISFLTWFYNIFIITADRIVDINYSDIVVHNVSETKLSHIEDVRYNQSGVIPTLFNYGNLFAQTAGTEENFEAHSIPKPKEATDVISDLIGD